MILRMRLFAVAIVVRPKAIPFELGEAGFQRHGGQNHHAVRHSRHLVEQTRNRWRRSRDASREGDPPGGTLAPTLRKPPQEPIAPLGEVDPPQACKPGWPL